MGAVVVLAFGFWLMAAGGMGSYLLRFGRHAQSRPAPLRGPRVARDYLRWAVPDLAGRSGNFRGMAWRGTADGLVCQHPDDVLVVGECRRLGDGAVYEARFLAGSIFLIAGMIGFMLALAAGFVIDSRRLDWTLLVPAGIIAFSLAFAAIQLRKAVKTGRELARYAAGLLDDLSRQPAS